MEERNPILATLDRLSVILSKLAKFKLSEKNRLRYHDLAQDQIRYLQKESDKLGGFDGN